MSFSDSRDKASLAAPVLSAQAEMSSISTQRQGASDLLSSGFPGGEWQQQGISAGTTVKARQNQQPQPQEPTRAPLDALIEEKRDQAEEKVATGEYDRLPGWQQHLWIFFMRTRGESWKEQTGWPTEPCAPKGADAVYELYGVTRPFNRKDEVVCIDLAWNNLQGDVGALDGLWKLKSLEVLNLGANRLTGYLSGPDLQQLGVLKELHLYRNGLRGRVPSEIGMLRHLSSLWLFENHFSGALPDAFGTMPSLVDVRINSNRLTGPIPTSLAGCTNIKVLNLQKNALDGPIPEDILTSCCRLRDLRLWSNKLTGPLSPEVSCLRYLEVLMVQKNQLSWVVPRTLTKCERLKRLDLSHNTFRGELPLQTFGTLTCLDSLNVSCNARISGDVPRELRQLRSLTFMDLSGTSLDELDEFAADVAAGRTAAPPDMRLYIEGYTRAEL